MKKLHCMILALVLVASMTAVAGAESANKLGDFANRLKKAAQQQAGTEEAAPAESVIESIGPDIRINDPFYQKVTSSAYLYESKYSKEANTLIELKNVSGRTLYPQSANFKMYDASGNVLGEKTYANCYPEMVEDGDSLFVWTYFYDPKCELDAISYFEVTLESKTSSYRNYVKIDATAMAMDGLAYALVENTTDSDIYGANAVVAVRNDASQLLDVVHLSTGNAIGLFPGSTMIMRDNITDHATDSALTTGNATAYVMYQLD